MKSVALVLAATLLSSAAFAQSTTVIKKEGIDGDTTVVKKETVAPTVVEKRVETTGTVGCATKSVTKTNDMGDSVTKTKSDC